jgi:hypothetical protein
MSHRKFLDRQEDFAILAHSVTSKHKLFLDGQALVGVVTWQKPSLW